MREAGGLVYLERRQTMEGVCMSILIKGMDMPRSCDECRFSIDAYCVVLCPKSDDPQFGKITTNSCPLIEIPPHGRLIDADEFEKKNAYFWSMDFVNRRYDDTLADLINNAPTVIEAEGRE